MKKARRPRIKRPAPSQPARRARLGLIVAVLIVAGALAAIELFRRPMRSSDNSSSPKSASRGTSSAPASATAPLEGSPSPTELPTVLTNPTHVARNLTAPAPRPEPSPKSRQLVQELSQFQPPGAVLTPEQITAWRQKFQQLIQDGAGSVPAIVELLEKPPDYAFGQVNAAQLGHGTLRLAMIEALRQIGGPSGTQALLRIVQSTAHPAEILTLARHLEALAPRQHRAAMLEAARQTLAMARRGELTAHDVGPLFEVFKSYGDTNVVADLRGAVDPWKYYATISLAQLPDAIGIPALIQLADETAGSRGLALELLMQVAPFNLDAQAFLLGQVREDKIPPSTWPYFGSVLAGDYYELLDSMDAAARRRGGAGRLRSGHIAQGNQNFQQGAPPGGFSPEQLNQQIGWVDELLAAATINEDARRELNRARESLLATLSKFGAGP